MHTSDTNSVLMINGIEAKDTGSIKCVISNKNGTDESLAKVIAVGKLSPLGCYC